jgi:hypothetical protein
MTAFELDRAWQIFERELMRSRDPRLALRLALLDLESRLFPDQHSRAAIEARPRPLLRRYRAIIEAVCSATHADVGLTCSYRRAGNAEMTARGVIVGLLSDLQLSTRSISEGIGMSNSVVNNCRVMRQSRPDWEALIEAHSHLLRRRS